MDPALRSSRAHVLVDPAALRADVPPLDDATEHHLRRVLRLRDGDPVSLTDGEGAWRIAAVVTGASWHLEATSAVVDEARREPVEIATAMPKGDRLDWLVQKVTEIGADRIMLLHAERSVVRWKPDKVDQQRARLQRIADEACRQSRRVWRAIVDGPVEAADAISGWLVAEPGGRPLAAGDRRVAIGPEGGWTPGELAAGGDQVAFGHTILRTETAAVAATTLCVMIER